MKKLFGTSGIRGIFNRDITLGLAHEVGLALGTILNERSNVVVGRDVRTSSIAIENAVTSGLESTGVSVFHAGLVPTPVLAYSARFLKASTGAMITASHNPPEYNGIKLWNSDTSAYTSAQEKEIEKIISSEKFRRASWADIGHSNEVGVIESYISKILGAVNIKNNYRIVLDCGGGAASVVSPKLLRNFSIKLHEIFCIPDGTFSGRPSEPKKENLSVLSRTVKSKNASIGFAHDGDADRISVVDETGNFVSGDNLLALLAAYELKHKKGKVVVPVDASKAVEDAVKLNGGELVQTKVGDVHVAEELKKCNGIFGGEACGAFIFPGETLCPDGILSSIKLIELLEKEDKKISELVKFVPPYCTLRKTIKCTDRKKTMQKISKKIKALRGVEKIISIDGIKAEFSDSWVLARASGTEPIIRITAEAKNMKDAKELLRKI